MTEFGGFTINDAQEIHRRVLGRSTVQKLPTGKPTVFNRAYYARLTANLPAATDPLTGYTQAEATVLRYLGTSVDTLDMEETEETIVITNRSTSYSASENDVIQVDRLGSEWAPKHASGGSNNPGDECGCQCDDPGDFFFNGNATVSCWEVTLDTTDFPQANGVVTLPAGTYRLCYDSARGLWLVDVGDLLTATNATGQDVTSQVVLDGEITFELPLTGTGNCCEQSELSICVTGTIPLSEISNGISAGKQYGYNNGFIDGFALNAYDDRVIFAGPTGTGAGTGQYQQFGTGTYLAPGTGTYGDNTGTGTGTGTFMWSDYEEGFYRGYKEGYATGYALGYSYATAGTGWIGTGSSPIVVGTGTSPGAGTGVGGP